MNKASYYGIPIMLITLGYLIFLGIGKDVFVLNQLNIRSSVITSLLVMIWVVFTLSLTRLFLPAIGYKFDDKSKGGDGFRSCPKNQ